MLPLIVFTLLFALASRRIDAGVAAGLVDFFTAVAGATTTIVDWIIAVAPIGVFALVAAAASRAGSRSRARRHTISSRFARRTCCSRC